MFVGTPTAVLGKKFAWPYFGKAGTFPKKDVQALIRTYVPEEKVGFTVKKDTRVVVVGGGADPTAVEQARAAGLELVAPATWLGFDVAEAPSIGGWLRALVELGYRFDTGCNEGDGSQLVVTTPLVTVQANSSLSEGFLTAHAARMTPLALDVWNTVVLDVGARFGSTFSAGGAPSDPNRPGPRSSFEPERGPTPRFWFKATASGGVSDLHPARATRADRVLPVTVLDEKLRCLGAEVYTTFHLRFNDAPVSDNQRTVLVFGGLEKDRASVSYAAVTVIHT